MVRFGYHAEHDNTKTKQLLESRDYSKCAMQIYALYDMDDDDVDNAYWMETDCVAFLMEPLRR